VAGGLRGGAIASIACSEPSFAVRTDSRSSEPLRAAAVEMRCRTLRPGEPGREAVTFPYSQRRWEVGGGRWFLPCSLRCGVPVHRERRPHGQLRAIESFDEPARSCEDERQKNHTGRLGFPNSGLMQG
jgi:hypothetical protein